MINSDKQPHHSLSQPSPVPWPEANEPVGPVNDRHRFTTLVSRTVVTYAVLFFIVALFMSLLGIDPLVRQGFMPKALLLFVGLAMVIAAANILTDYSQEHGLNWRSLVLNALHSVTRRIEPPPQEQ